VRLLVTGVAERAGLPAADARALQTALAVLGIVGVLVVDLEAAAEQLRALRASATARKRASRRVTVTPPVTGHVAGPSRDRPPDDDQGEHCHVTEHVTVTRPGTGQSRDGSLSALSLSAASPSDSAAVEIPEERAEKSARVSRDTPHVRAVVPRATTDIGLHAALLDEWNRQTANGHPSYDLRTAEEWIRPCVPALLARDADALGLFRRHLERWLAAKATTGKSDSVKLRFFCKDLPDLLVSSGFAPLAKGEPSRLFPLAPPPPPPPEDWEDAAAEGLAAVRATLGKPVTA
jgi:hypothetical protein